MKRMTASAVLAAAWLLAACVGTLPGPAGSGLTPCSEWPNCVSSDARDAVHAIAPLRLAVPPEQAWPAVRAAVAQLPGTTIVSDTGTLLRAESRSSTFGFIDDLELQLRPAQQAIAVRSASRVGLNDLGANARRVEALRAALQAQGIVR